MSVTLKKGSRNDVRLLPYLPYLIRLIGAFLAFLVALRAFLDEIGYGWTSISQHAHDEFLSPDYES